MIPNRSQFEGIMRQSFEEQFNSLTPQNILSLLSNDLESWNQIASNYLRIPGRIQFFLNAYDEATNDEERRLVIRSFDPRDFGNEIVDPSDLIKDMNTGGKYPDVGSVVQRRSVQVDGTSIGNTLIFTAPPSNRIIPVAVSFYLLNAVGLSVVSTCSIGTNGPNYNNILGATALTGLTANTTLVGTALTGLFSSVAPGADVYCRVSVPATATTYNIICTVIGFMV